MTKEQIYEFIIENPIFFLATQEGSQPRVRVMNIVDVNEKGILFCTGKPKDVCIQLSENPLVEMCFYNAKENKQIRIDGKVKQTEDLEIKKQVVEKFPFLKPKVEKEGYEVLAPFYLRNAKATVWTMETAFEPKQYIDL